MFEMKLKLLDKYEAAITWLSPQPAHPLWHPKETISVWLAFDEGKEVGGCLSFPVSIEAKDYTEEEFLATVRAEAEATLTRMIKKDVEDREESLKREESRKALNKQVAALGDKFGIEYRLNTR